MRRINNISRLSLLVMVVLLASACAKKEDGGAASARQTMKNSLLAPGTNLAPSTGPAVLAIPMEKTKS